ncbi:MAG: DUF4397 domain-containing protein [Lewinellaceae bacterium]|nr:DUF4397 domain-containing protein [Lewinellaceae bacterium]
MRTLYLFLIVFLGAFTVQAARVQFVHNASNAPLDIYFGDERITTDLAYRNATPFLDLQSDSVLLVGVAPAGSRSAVEVYTSVSMVFGDDGAYIVMITGTVGGLPGIELVQFDLASEMAEGPNNVGIHFFQGTSDLQDVDLLLGRNILFNNVAYGHFGGYLEVPASGNYHLTLTPGFDNTVPLVRWSDDLSFWAGKTAVLFTSGQKYSLQPDFAVLLALSDGRTIPIKVVTPEMDDSSLDRWLLGSDIRLFPNPATDWVQINLRLSQQTDLQAVITNDKGRVVETRNFGQLPSGHHQLQFYVSMLPKGRYFVRLLFPETGVSEMLPFYIATH